MTRIRKRLSRPLYIVALFVAMSAWIWGLVVGVAWLLNA